ncbi:dienelactone hydrolase [Sagittula marina]|uniref:Dienelactone hydrolase n=1 Tax=Sagittula marina TaxID=943940 RepID=A0A7W6DSA6_9RHOB|nr:CocE/NonD family hydrolase [Sagittula marina]MBB3988238.1 dienelactone hydrolase [Sagittula marina]
MNTPSELPAFLEARRLELPMDLAFAFERGPFDVGARRLARVWQASLPPWREAATGTVQGEVVTLRFATGAESTGRFVRPAGQGPHPAVLLLHDHGGAFDHGWQKLFDDPGTQGSRGTHYDGQAPAQAFVDAGFAVLCLDALGWGARQTGGYAGQQALAANAQALGWSLAGLVAAEDAQAAAWLAAQPGIDAGRMGAFGFSFGGLRAWQVAALSAHIAAHASLSWMACCVDLMRPGAPLLAGQSAFYMLHPKIAGRADFPDLAGLAARKPQFYRSGRGDRHMPEDSVIRAWGRIARICRAAGGPRPDTALHDAGHTCPRETLAEAVAFLKTRL